MARTHTAIKCRTTSVSTTRKIIRRSATCSERKNLKKVDAASCAERFSFLRTHDARHRVANGCHHLTVACGSPAMTTPPCIRDGTAAGPSAWRLSSPFFGISVAIIAKSKAPPWCHSRVQTLADVYCGSPQLNRTAGMVTQPRVDFNAKWQQRQYLAACRPKQRHQPRRRFPHEEQERSSHWRRTTNSS